MLVGSIYYFVIKETILNKSDTHSNSLKSTIPGAIIKKFGLKKGSKIEWDIQTIVDGRIVEDKGGKKEPEEVIIVRKSKGA